MLTNLIVVIISQYIRVSNHHIVHLKSAPMLYVNYMSIKLEKYFNWSKARGNMEMIMCGLRRDDILGESYKTYLPMELT